MKRANARLGNGGATSALFSTVNVAEVRGDARTNLDILGRLGVTVVEIADSQAWELHFSEISDCTLIVDAIFGTGLNAPLSGLMETVVALASDPGRSRWNQRRTPISL